MTEPKNKAPQGALILNAGREKSVLQRHPWIFSGAIERIEGAPQMGQTVAVMDNRGQFLAWAAYSPASQIRARIWPAAEDETIDAAYLHRQLEKAVRRRAELLADPGCTACRLVYAEADGVPGLVVDRYADVLVAQFLSAGVEIRKAEIAADLLEISGARTVYERSDAEVRRLEGLAEREGLLLGEPPAEPLEIRENGLRYLVSVQSGQKTGFYLDQRFNRARVGALAHGRDVLNCFSYTGGFSASALAGGAKHVLSVDTSAEALELGRQNLALNGLWDERAANLEGDVFHVLRSFRDERRSFDLIVLDPPKFAFNASQVEKAARGYKDINLLALKLLNPGGLLFTFSCSGAVSSDLFQKIIAGAAQDSGRFAQVIERLSQGPDHPVALNFPESAYLKGLVIRVE